MTNILRAFIVNKNKYAEGQQFGLWVEFPVTNKDYQEAMQLIRVDGNRYKNIFIEKYEVGIDGLGAYLTKEETIEDLNKLSTVISKKLKTDEAMCCALIEYYADHSHDLNDLINILNKDMDKFTLVAFDFEEDFAKDYIKHIGGIKQIDSETLYAYFDVASFGSSLDIDDVARYDDYNSEVDYENITDEKLGESYISMIGIENFDANELEEYFDYEKYGTDVLTELDKNYLLTEYGFIYKN